MSVRFTKKSFVSAPTRSVKTPWRLPPWFPFARVVVSLQQFATLSALMLFLYIFPDGRFGVMLDNEHRIIAYTAGKMKKNRIKTLAGDRVTIEMSPYDLEKGRLIFRHKDERAGPPAARPW